VEGDGGCGQRSDCNRGIPTGNVQKPEEPRARPCQLAQDYLAKAGIGLSMEEVIVVDHLPVYPPLSLEDGGSGVSGEHRARGMFDDAH